MQRSRVARVGTKECELVVGEDVGDERKGREGRWWRERSLAGGGKDTGDLPRMLVLSAHRVCSRKIDSAAHAVGVKARGSKGCRGTAGCAEENVRRCCGVLQILQIRMIRITM